jgi:CO/xanthine dehydrogenase FAD-binding subunit
MAVLRPATPARAVQWRADEPGALALAGGTDLMVDWNAGTLNGRMVLDLSRLDAWRRISPGRGVVRVGALATHTAIQRHGVLRERFPLLVASAATVGGVQIQNRGTIGGNIANASPAGDTFPALAVYGAAVEVVSARGRRRVPFLDVFAGPKQTTLAADELIERVELPDDARPPDARMFRKVGTRAAQAISKVVAAGLLWFDEAGCVEDVRFAVGSVAPTVRRLSTAERFLRRQRLTPDVAAHAASLVPQDVAPIDDIRSTADYRLLVTSRLFEQFLTESAGG